MQKGGQSSTNWKITEDIEEFHHFLYRESSFRSQGANKQAKIRTKNVKKAETEEDKKSVPFRYLISIIVFSVARQFLFVPIMIVVIVISCTPFI